MTLVSEMSLSTILYPFVLAFVRICRFLEFGIIQLFSGTLRRICFQKLENIGVVLELPGSPNDREECEKILSKCDYDKVIRLKVHKNSALTRFASQAVLGFGETFMDGDWDVTSSEDDITELMSRVMKSDIVQLVYNPWHKFLLYLQFEAFNMQTREMVKQIPEVHYDLGNDLYESMLDPWMQYTCGYWAKADNLNDAQLHKMDLIARKLDLKPGMKVLDLGCGWGTLCKYLAENYGVTCVGVNISKEGIAYGKKLCEGLPVDLRLQDYRDVNEKFDRVVSIGLIEHVGFRNYRTLMKVVHKCLKDDGIFLLHGIGVDHPLVPRVEPWTLKYIFPCSCLPRFEEIVEAKRGLFVTEDWHNLGRDYEKTLCAWRDNFIRNWPRIQKKYGERFYRMWIFYLSGSAGLFKSRSLQLWQIVLSKEGIQKEYRAAR